MPEDEKKQTKQPDKILKLLKKFLISIKEFENNRDWG